MRPMSTFTKLPLVLGLAFAVLTPACKKGPSPEELAIRKQLEDDKTKLAEQKTALEKDVAAANATTEEFQATVDEVQQALASVREKELKIIKASLTGAKEGGMAKNRKTEILEDIKDIQKALKDSRNKLANVSKQRNEAQSKVKVLQTLIDQLEKTLEEKETTIAMLQQNIEELNTKVATLETNVKEKEDTIAQQVLDANRAYFLIDAKKVLKQKGVVEKRGDVAGVGGRWILTGKIDETLLTEMDIREKMEFEIGAKSTDVIVLSDHTKDSYEVVATGAKTSTLKIKDAAKFWQGSRRLIVITN